MVAMEALAQRWIVLGWFVLLTFTAILGCVLGLRAFERDRRAEGGRAEGHRIPLQSQRVAAIA